jgi:hypothetical protein
MIVRARVRPPRLGYERDVAIHFARGKLNMGQCFGGFGSAESRSLVAPNALL